MKTHINLLASNKTKKMASKVSTKYRAIINILIGNLVMLAVGDIA